MTIPRQELIRLLAAVLGSFGACWFSALYTHFARIRFEFEHQNVQLMAANEVLAAHCDWLFVIPVVSLAIGLWHLRTHPHSQTTFEVLVSSVSLFSMAIILFCLLTWQIQNIPAFSHMEYHF